VAGLPLNLESDLESYHEEVTRQLPGSRAIEDRPSELGVLPEKRHLEVLGQIPVEADVGGGHAVGQEIRIGEAAGETLVAQSEPVVAPAQLPGPEADPA